MILPPKDYYDHMYDIESLTKLNSSRAHIQTSQVIQKAEHLIRTQQCVAAVQLLRDVVHKEGATSQAQMLLSALWVKDRLFCAIKDVEQKSPKFCALQELSAYLGLSERDIKKNMLVEVPVHEDWEHMSINPKDHKDINRFYSETNSYVYELMAANHIVQTLFTFAVMAERMQRLGVQTVLDYGGGAGTISILLSRLGYKVTFADLQSKTANFAKWRFAARDLAIPVVELSGDESSDLTTGALKNLQFDCIISTEVIEHVLYPLELIQSFASKLFQGGIAIVSESCNYTEQFASHLESNKKYGGVHFIEQMRKVGFEQAPVDFFIPQQIFIKL